MITKLILDTVPEGSTSLIRAGLPVQFLGFAGNARTPQGTTEWCYAQTPNGDFITIPAAAVGSGINGPEETLSVLAEQLDLKYDALVKACREGRVLARKSGGTWLTTKNAIEYALSQGAIRR